MRHQDFSVSLFMREQRPPVHSSQSPWVRQCSVEGWKGFETASNPARKGGDGQNRSKISATDAEYMALL